LDVHGAADVAGDAGGGLGGGDVAEFSVGQFGGHDGVLKVVGAGGAAAHVGFGEGDHFQAGDQGEEGFGGGGDFLGVNQVAGFVIGDGFFDAVGHGGRADFEEDFGDVADALGELAGAGEVLGVVAEEVLVFAEHGAAAGDVAGDEF